MLTHANLIRLCRGRDLLRDSEQSVASIADALGYSQYHFIRQFKALFGATPNRYRVEHRMRRARTKLATGDDSVTDICMDVGYSSLGSFSASFSRQFGKSPTSYRDAAPAEPASLTPDCLSLQRAAWRQQSQFSRSEQPPTCGRKVARITADGDDR